MNTLPPVFVDPAPNVATAVSVDTITMANTVSTSEYLSVSLIHSFIWLILRFRDINSNCFSFMNATSNLAAHSTKTCW